MSINFRHAEYAVLARVCSHFPALKSMKLPVTKGSLSNDGFPRGVQGIPRDP